MSKIKIITGEENPILRETSKEVVHFDGKLKKIVKDLKETMIASNGLGLAAPQVGVHLRIFLIIFDYKGDEQKLLAMVNPKIEVMGDEMEVGEEGCLSLPGIWGDVERHRDIRVEFWNESGVRQVLELSGLDAREVQHENDHLDGVLFVDRLVE